MDVIAEMERHKLMPVLRIDRKSDVRPLMRALCEGGLSAAEITFRTECGAAALEAARREFPEMLIGAGTVVCEEQARRAYDCGAMFIVGPGWSDEVAAFCTARGLAYIPGCVTPTEITRAVNAGFSAVKFFPASAFGGLKTIRALSAPFPGVRFMPTGGVGEDNLAEYLREKSVFACGGSWMAPPRDVAEGNFDKVVSLVKKACAIAAQA